MFLGMGVRTAIYCRISDDRLGEGLGVGRQRADCEALARRLGWTITEHFVDNDVSAFKGKPRPAYRRLLERARAGDFDGILAWHTDRLHRSLVELEEFIEVCDEHAIRVQTVQAGMIDLSTPSGRVVARMLAATARYESEHKAERIRRKAAELAEAGKIGGGGTRPYGYERDFRTVREDEAAVVRDLAARFLAGETLGALTRWLNDNDVRTATGRTWSVHTLRRMLGSGRISGQREHHGVITTQAVWPAIITPEQTARIRAILADPARRHKRAPRRYLLTQLVTCERCGHKMVGRPREDGRRRYACPTPPVGAGCGKTFILADDVESLVYNAVTIALDGPNLRAAVAAKQVRSDDAEAILERVKALSQRREELSEMFARGEIDRAQMLAGARAAQTEIDEANSRLAAMTHTDALSEYIGNGDALRAGWTELTGDRQRAIVRAVVESVAIGPAVRGRNRFDPNRIHITWRY